MLTFKISRLNIFIIILTLICFSSNVFSFSGVKTNEFESRLFYSDYISINNESLITDDTVKTSTDTIKVKAQSTEELRSHVKYNSADTIRFDLIGDKVYLRNKAEITYENMNIKAGYIEIDWSTHLLYAEGVKDTDGVIKQLPVFTQDNQSFTAYTMKYNFDTKRGKIAFVTTKEGQGYIHGDTVKRDANNDFYIRSGKYTTCELDTPHYYLASNKLRVINQRRIVTGPAYLVIEGVPTPLVIPFGFFPNKKGRSSGLIFPTFGESATRGFFFQGLGYYFGLSDYVDLAAVADVYTLGSYNARVSSRYARRYRFGGNIDMSYSENKTSEPELSDYSVRRDFIVNWSHIQDPKAHPGSHFGASVRAGTGSYYQNNLSSAPNYLNNTYSSSISYSRSWLGTPFSLSTALTHSQNTLSRQIQVSAPDLSFNIARITPFKIKARIGEEKW
ncbi:MAG: LPS-assembly protein LptD, partial [Bacteroidia bacterium]|nr:LPS-assembly protein LptD [Bacteroidia bacterium]